jgi:hypothetical protein
VRQLHPDDDTHAPEDGSETVEIVRAPMRREVALDVGLSDGTKMPRATPPSSAAASANESLSRERSPRNRH